MVSVSVTNRTYKTGEGLVWSVIVKVPPETLAWA